MSIFEDIKQGLLQAIAHEKSMKTYTTYNLAICPVCGGNLELWADGFEHCDSCDYSTKE